jgi:5-methylcytosine-specific restriction endonuclease McrA
MELAEERRRKAAYMRVWSAKNRDRLLEEQRRRYAEDPALRDRVARGTRLQELRKRGGVDPDTEAFLSVLTRDPCAYCGELMTPPDRNSRTSAGFDHVDPRGNSNWTNLAGACRSCNATKGKLPLLLSMLERQLRRDLTPIAEQVFLIKDRSSARRRIDF